MPEPGMQKERRPNPAGLKLLPLKPQDVKDVLKLTLLPPADVKVLIDQTRTVSMTPDDLLKILDAVLLRPAEVAAIINRMAPPEIESDGTESEEDLADVATQVLVEEAKTAFQEYLGKPVEPLDIQIEQIAHAYLDTVLK